MLLTRAVVILGLVLASTSCKIQISTSPHGRVESNSSAYICSDQSPCDIDVSDEFFDETFRAIPNQGYKFTAWRTKPRSFCGGQNQPCRLATNGFPGTPLMDILDSDQVFFLEPVFGQPNKWTGEKANMPIGGTAISSCLVGGNLYIFGLGWAANGVPGGVMKYAPSNDSWTALANMPTPRGWSTTAVVKNRCYVIGGASEPFGDALATVEEFTPRTGQWRTRASLPESRVLAASAVVNGKIYVVGGGDRDALRVEHRGSVAIYDPTTDSWESGSDIPTTRILLRADTVDGFVYAIGGLTSSGAASAAVERYDPNMNKWSTMANMSVARGGHTVTESAGKLYVIGGWTGSSTYRTLEIYNPGNDTWASGADMDTARWGHGGEVIDGQIMVFGGNSSPDAFATPLSTAELYTP